MKLKNYFLLFIFLCFSIFAHSGVILVTNGSDNTSGSLRQAIIAATPGDSIVIDYKGAFALITPIEINNLDSVTIIGPYAKHMYFFGDPTSFDAYFNIKNSTRIEFQNMGFWNSFGGFNAITRAVDVDSSSTVLFTSCLFEGCQPSTGSGGAIRVRNGSRIRVNYCSFINNSSEENGGAIWMDSTLVTADIQSSTFYRNTADNGKGGALYASFVQNLNSVEIINNTFHSNLASSALGDSSTASAIYTNDASTGFLTTYVTIRNNILYQNGYAGQSQVFYTNPSFSASFYTTVTHNYYYAFSASDPIPPRFTNNSFGVDYSGFPPTVTTLGLRNNVVTDGYGLKYFTITEGNSPLIDVASSSNVSTNKDCRRAPRFMDGDLNSTEINDIGAAEYTPYRVTDPLFSYTWEDLVNTEINVSPNPGEIHYVEFDLSDPITGVRLNNFVPQFNRTVYIDGYSQDGSAIPGSNNTSTNTDTVAPARNLVTFYSQGAGADNAVQFNNAPNSIIAGLSMIDFNLNAVVIEPAATGTTVFGNVIGVESNAANNLSVSPGNGAGRAGVLVKANDVTIGGDFHHQRNVIVDNGYDETTAFTDYFGANIHVVAPVDNLSIKGNIIGLHPNGKDTIPIQFTNIKRPNGIYIESGSNINIGGQYLFGKNIISNHPGNGIFQYNGTSGNITIDNNYIGTSFDGTDPLGNQNGILLKTSSAGSNIGGYLGNIISANDSSGIRIIDGQSIRILGNTIGGDQTLTANNFGNDKGIYVTGSSGANATPILIGLDDYLSDNERNVILNNNVGIYLSGTNVQEVPIRGNLIGLPAYNATNALPNVVGIKIDSGAHHNYIGYDGSSGNFNQINLISGNSDAGVWVEGDLVNNNRVASNIIGGSIPVSGALNSLGNLTGVRFSNIQSGTSNIIGNENDSDLKLIVVGNTVGVHVTGS